jgi:2-haloalkanoic acid dehalogenase type II
MRAWDIVTFDCYGTLIDWRTGIATAFQDEKPELDADAVLDAYNEIEPLVEAERYQSYRDVLAESASRVAARLGCPIARESARFLADSLPSWRPFEDTNRALERLASAGHRLGILSNVDDDLLAETRTHFTVEFELIITAQQVGSYKPAPAHFTAAHKRIGAARWLHAAQSYFHDVLPTAALGIDNAWVNRRGEAGGEVRPLIECRNLAELANRLC